jgi:hypothetical protein
MRRIAREGAGDAPVWSDAFGLRASLAVSPTRPPAALFSSGRQKMAQPRPRILVFARIWAFIHPASPCHPRPPLPGHARGVRRKPKRGKCRGKFPRAWWPRLVGEKGQSSSSSHRPPHAVKACRRWTHSFHAGSRVNARLYLSRTYSVWPHSPPLSSFSPVFSPRNILEQWRATATARRTTALASVLYTNGRGGCSTWRANRRRRTSAHPEAGA